MVFESQLEKTKIDLENADEALKRTQLSTGMVQVDGQARAMIDSAAHLRAQIVAKEVQIQAMRSYAGDENPALTQAQTELDGLRAQFNKMVGTKGSSADDVFLPKGGSGGRTGVRAQASRREVLRSNLRYPGKAT